MPKNIPPNLLLHLDEISTIVQQSALGLVVDFDGTISELVPSPEDAQICPDAIEPLRTLSNVLKLTAIVSGRHARDLQSAITIKTAM